MNYKLEDSAPREQVSTLKAFGKLAPLVTGEWGTLALALVMILVNSGLQLAGPFLIGVGVDRYITGGDFHGLLLLCVALLAVYAASYVAGYLQTRIMGGIGQRVLFTLRNQIFGRLQALPVAFFNQNKAGDLIARINGDAQALNEFFSYQLMQFASSVVMIAGAGAALLWLDMRLGLIALAPAAFLLAVTQLLSPWVRRKNRESRTAIGGLSAEIAESLANFKVVVAFNRQDYFRKRFNEANHESFTSSVRAGIANAVFTPIYGLSGNVAQLLVLAFGIRMIASGSLTVGLLISFIGYVVRFYDPLRQIAAIWAALQGALAGWDRISPLLHLESDLTLQEAPAAHGNEPLLAFENVSFTYPDGGSVLKGVTLTLERGKSYALVGPTGGGKTTTASLMARLYDPTEGTVSFMGRNLRTWTDAERTARIGFILQEPFLFAGTVRDNLLYGNDKLSHLRTDELQAVLRDKGLEDLIARFDGGLESQAGDALSLGQRQLIAFMRAVLREPDLLILDEATANIDTLTEAQLDAVIKKLPRETTLVTIAHRLNTIEAADQIFFVNGGRVAPAGSLEQAVDMLMHGKRSS